MGVTKSVTVRLEPGDSLGEFVGTNFLSESVVRDTLRRAGYPSVDAVRLMREVHVDLEQRPKL